MDGEGGEEEVGMKRREEKRREEKERKGKKKRWQKRWRTRHHVHVTFVDTVVGRTMSVDGVCPWSVCPSVHGLSTVCRAERNWVRVNMELTLC